MIIDIDFTYDRKLSDLDERIKLAVVEKLIQLTRMAYDKVEENLSGKVLQKRTGQLLESVHETVNTSGEIMVGSVFMDPASPKAFALEKGGEGFYPIVATKASVLAWFDKSGQKRFAKSVIHPPSKAYRYLGLVADEMREIVPTQMHQAIQDVLDGL